MQRVTIPLAIALCSSFLAACGGSTRSPQTGSTAAHVHDRSPAAGALARARAVAFVRAVNLTAADVPGFAPSREKHAKSRAERLAEGDLYRCAGARGPSTSRAHEDLANAGSPSFQLKRGIIDLSVSSEVGVARSAAVARAELGVIHQARVRACFERYLHKVLSGSGAADARVEGVSIQSGNPPAPGTSGSFGWRVSATFGLHGVKIPVYLDLLGFVYGPARVTLISSGAIRPFPAFAQQHLFELLLGRAIAHGL